MTIALFDTEILIQIFIDIGFIVDNENNNN